MKSLSEKELVLMNHLWRIESGYLKDLISEYQDPKPAYTTISTVISRLISKNHVGFHLHGRDKQYYPVLKKEDYFSSKLSGIISESFQGSAYQFASFFTKEQELSLDDLEKLKGLIDEEIKDKKK